MINYCDSCYKKKQTRMAVIDESMEGYFCKPCREALGTQVKVELIKP